MKKPNNKKQNNGGILSAIAALFKGGAAAGGASGAAVTSGIFATKAGMLGLLLGGATIAAGVGAVYHLAGGSATKTAYSPELFQNSYYEEQAAIAEAERNQNNDRRASVVNSTIDMFSASAKQSGYFDQGSSDSALSSVEMPDGSDVSMAGSSGSAEASASSSVASAGESGSSTASGSTKLASKSLSSGRAGGSGSSRVSSSSAGSMGGLKAGMGKNFNPKMASAGKSSAMAANMSKKVSSARSASRSRGSKRAFSQAKFANNMSKKAVASGSFEASRTAASAAFTGEAAGGDAGDSVEGVGMDTSGMAVGTALKNGTPNGNSNLKSVPPVSESENASPWKDLVKKVAVLSLVAMGLFLVGKLLAKMAKNATVHKAFLIGAIKVIAGLMAVIGVLILAAAVSLATKYGQKMYGLLYGLAGALTLWEAYSLFKQANGMNTDAEDTAKHAEVQSTSDSAKASANGTEVSSDPKTLGNAQANTNMPEIDQTIKKDDAWGLKGLVNDVDLGDIGKKIESGIASSVAQQAIGDVSNQDASSVGGKKS